MPEGKPFRVLSLDGGGMRGTYTATYLSQVSASFAKKRGVERLDLGAAFDLIVGTSTGGIIACALAVGLPLEEIVDLYRVYGPAIFPQKIPKSFLALAKDIWTRGTALASGTQALRSALTQKLGNLSLGQIYEQRRIALAISAIELSQHRSWVFKTPHLKTTNHRDDHYRLVDVCLATSAAPIFRSLAAVDHPGNGTSLGYHVFADGGLWANNPVLIGLIDALEMTEPGREIEIFCLGTCPRPEGEHIKKTALDRGLLEWRFGSLVAGLSIDAQEFAYDNMARMLAKHVDRHCKVLRFPREQVPAVLMPHLDLDDTRPESMRALINQARTDSDMTNSRCGDPSNADGRLITSLFSDAPPILT